MAEQGLYPVIEMEDFIDEENEEELGYLPSAMWDMEKGDFVCDVTNRISRSSGVEALKMWCIKAVATERFQSLAYSDDFGTEMEDALKEGDDNAIDSSVQRTITEALMVNPLIEAVSDFEFKHKEGTLIVLFNVYAVDFESFDVETTIDLEE